MMDSSKAWLSQSGKNPNYIDITFVRPDLALTNLKPPTQPEILKQHGIRSILSLYQPNAADLDISDASVDWSPVQSFKPIHHLLGEGETPHPLLVQAGIQRRVIHSISDDGNNSPDILRKAVDLLGELHGSNAPVLVHCRMGASRTPAVVACYLAKKEGLTFRAVIDEIARTRSVAICEELAITITEANGVKLE